MPATRCQATFLLAAACGLLIHAPPAVGEDPAVELEFEDALDADDEVHLLQERVLERRRSAAPAAEQKKARAPSVCEDEPAELREKAFADRDATVIDLAQLMPEAPAAAAEAEPADASASPTAVSQDAPESAKTHIQLFRYAMDALTILVLLDGCRRWRSGGGSGEADCGEEPPPCGSEAFQQLARAAAAGDEARARELLGRGSSASEVDFWGCTALHSAAKGGMCVLAADLLGLGAELDAADAWDDTPLHTAARAGHAEVCELLVARGAKVDAANVQSWTPLVVAGHSEHRAVCLLLLGVGAGAGGLPWKELPPLLRELLPGGEEETPATAAPEGELPRWPSDADWEEHMQESVDDRRP